MGKYALFLLIALSYSSTLAQSTPDSSTLSNKEFYFNYQLQPNSRYRIKYSTYAIVDTSARSSFSDDKLQDTLKFIDAGEYLVETKESVEDTIAVMVDIDTMIFEFHVPEMLTSKVPQMDSIFSGLSECYGHGYSIDQKNIFIDTIYGPELSMGPPTLNRGNITIKDILKNSIGVHWNRQLNLPYGNMTIGDTFTYVKPIPKYLSKYKQIERHEIQDIEEVYVMPRDSTFTKNDQGRRLINKEKYKLRLRQKEKRDAKKVFVLENWIKYTFSEFDQSKANFNLEGYYYYFSDDRESESFTSGTLEYDLVDNYFSRMVLNTNKQGSQKVVKLSIDKLP